MDLILKFVYKNSTYNCRRTVRKDGPNKGRKFWACPQGPSRTCNFFAWFDDANAGDAGNGIGDGNTWNGGAGPSRRTARGATARGRGQGAPRAAGGGSKRKCGLCQLEGTFNHFYSSLRCIAYILFYTLHLLIHNFRSHEKNVSPKFYGLKQSAKVIARSPIS